MNGQGWVRYSFAPSTLARYISVTALGQTGGAVLEMAVYGNLSSAASTQPPPGTKPVAPPLGLLLGLNAVSGTDPALLVNVTSTVRENQASRGLRR